MCKHGFRIHSFTHQQFEHSSFLVEFGCYEVQQLHLMFT